MALEPTLLARRSQLKCARMWRVLCKSCGRNRGMQFPEQKYGKAMGLWTGDCLFCPWNRAKNGVTVLGVLQNNLVPFMYCKIFSSCFGISGTNLGCYNKHVLEYEGKTAPLAFRQLSSKSQSQCHCQRQASLLSPHAGMWPSTASNEWVSSAIRSMYIFTWKKKKRSRFVKSFDWKIECKMIQTYNADSIVKLKFMSRYYVKCITAIHDAQCVFFA